MATVALVSPTPHLHGDGGYLALVDKLAATVNPKACFVLGVRLVFTQGPTDQVGTAYLKLAAAANHKLRGERYGDKEAERYIRQVEGERDVVAHMPKPKASKTN